MDFWIRAAQLVLSLSILIVLHEFGHFIPARLFKTRVEKFYLFFNPYFSLYKKKVGDTEWGIGWLPLGGYVKIAGMIDESMDKEQMAQPAQPWEFRSKPAWQRLIIMMGGVIVNVIVGFLIFIMVLAVWGEDKVNQQELHHGIAVHPYMQQFGFQSGDKILTMDGEKVEDLQRIGMEILIFDHRNFTVQHKDGSIQKIKLPVDIGSKMWENNVEAGAFDFRSHMSIIAKVEAKSTAAKAGLKKGDIIKKLDNQKISSYAELSGFINTKRPNDKVNVTYERDGQTKVVPVVLVKNDIIQTDFKGLELENLSDADKKNFRIDYGVKIKEVSNERLLPYKDELEGSIILDINGVKASDVETVSRATNNTNESKGTSVKLMTKNGQVMRIII
jgi:regulator of sigma E protease